MEYGRVAGLDKEVSRIGHGCMALRDGSGQEQSNAILDAALHAGITLFDHAVVYGGGACERAFGVWLTERGLRERVVILDKGCHPAGSELRVTPACIREDVSLSLSRLSVESIDLWLFHRDDPAQPVGPLVETLNELRSAGRIGAFGGSNWTHRRIEEANEYAHAKGLIPFAASSPNLSLAEQIDSPWGSDCVTISGPSGEEARRWYAASGLAVFAWSSLARGFLSGRVSRESFETVKADLEEHTVRCYVTEDNWRRLDRAAELARERGLTVPQIALAFVLSQPMNLFALIGAASQEEIRANLGALSAELTPAEMEWLDLRRERR